MSDKDYEEFKVSAENLASKIREIITEGNAKRIILKNDGGDTLFEIPLTAGVAAAGLLVILAPVLAVVAAIAAVVTQVTVVVVKRDAADSAEESADGGEDPSESNQP